MVSINTLQNYFTLFDFCIKKLFSDFQTLEQNHEMPPVFVYVCAHDSHHSFWKTIELKLQPCSLQEYYTCKMSDTFLFDSFFLSFGISNLNQLKQVSLSTNPAS